MQLISSSSELFDFNSIMLLKTTIFITHVMIIFEVGIDTSTRELFVHNYSIGQRVTYEFMMGEKRKNPVFDIALLF